MAERAPFVCRDCGYRTGKWLGRCPSCDAWDTLERCPPREPARAGALVQRFDEIDASDVARLSTGIGELDRVLGGGLVAGGVALVGGEPGIGKSTLLLQAASRMADAGRSVLYVSGEESAAQVRLRGDRLGLHSAGLLVAAETDVDGVIAAARAARPAALVVDSVQAVRTAEAGSVPGSVTQVRECAVRIVDCAKQERLPVLLVGHVTKDGALAGPRVLEHLVDAVIQFEGDRRHDNRILRALKNRFGPTDEIGVFRMTDAGLLEVDNPSELFLAERPAGAPGSVVLAAIEGSRPVLVELQALVGEPVQGSPRRTAIGIDGNRLALLLAVLERRAGASLANRDVFVNVAGGVSVAEPAADLAVAAAVASAARQVAVPDDWVVFGEVGLTGEVRAVSRMEPRLREAERLGFTTAIAPVRAAAGAAQRRLRRIPVQDLAEALHALF